MKTIIKNQVHNTKCNIDKNGNEKKKLWLKDGNTTMLFIDCLTENGCKAFINHINNFLIKSGNKTLPNNKFLITR